MRFASVFGGLGALLLLTTGSVCAASAEVSVQLNVDTTQERDGLRTPTEATGNVATGPLAPGESSLLYFARGALDSQGGKSPDSFQFGDHESYRQKSPTSNFEDVWTVECTPRAVQEGVVELEVHWVHRRSSAPGETRIVGQDLYRVVLSGEQRSLVAYVPAPDSSERIVEYLLFVALQADDGRLTN